MVSRPYNSDFAGILGITLDRTRIEAEDDPNRLDALMELIEPLREYVHEWAIEAFLDGKIHSGQLFSTENTFLILRTNGSGYIIEYDNIDEITWSSANGVLTLTMESWRTGTIFDL